MQNHVCSMPEPKVIAQHLVKLNKKPKLPEVDRFDEEIFCFSGQCSFRRCKKQILSLTFFNLKLPIATRAVRDISVDAP